MFFEGHKNLRIEGNGKLFRNFGHIFCIQKHLFELLHYQHSTLSSTIYIYSCSLQRRLSISIKINGIAYKRMNRRQLNLKN
jgi:hypothetical protein